MGKGRLILWRLILWRRRRLAGAVPEHTGVLQLAGLAYRLPERDVAAFWASAGLQLAETGGAGVRVAAAGSGCCCDRP